MRLKTLFFYIQIPILLVYSLIIGFSLNLTILKVFFGVVCILFLPGLNLIKTIKPKTSFFLKIGYSTILSLTIENIIMFLAYLIFYDQTTTLENPSFFFKEKLLIFSILIFTCFLIIFQLLKNKNLKKDLAKVDEIDKNVSINTNKNAYNYKIIIIFSFYLFSLLILILSCINSYNEIVYYNYREPFTFFVRVPIEFYFFLLSCLVSLSYLIVYSKKPILILVSLSLFLYVLWLLPYFQIGFFFNDDSRILFKFINDYFKHGIRASPEGSFLIYNVNEQRFTIFGYSTSFFTGILLVLSTGLPTHLVLWYIYPLIFIPFPFFFYSIFENFQKHDNSNKLILILLTFFTLMSPQIVKNAHSATAGVIATYTYFILIIEFYLWLKVDDLKFKNHHFFLTIFLYIFLCLTHTEEPIYFIIIFVIFALISISIKLNSLEHPNYSFFPLKSYLFKINFIFFILILIFYLIKEFFQYLKYLYVIPGFQDDQNLIYVFYENTKINFKNIYNGGFSISIFIILVIIIGYFLFFSLLYVYFTRCIEFNKSLQKFLLNLYFEHIKLNFSKIFSQKYVFLPFFILFSVVLILFNYFFFPYFQIQGIYLIIDLYGSTFIIIFNSFLFLKGIMYNEEEMEKKIFFLIAIFSSSSLIIMLLYTGNIGFSFHILNSKFPTYFIFFNLILIQNGYFKNFKKKKKIHLFLLILLFLFLGVFYSLRKLKYG